MAVSVSHGVNKLASELAGLTVESIRTRTTMALNTDPEAASYVNGQPVGCDYVVSDGDRVEFIKKSGQKGQ